MSESFQEDNNDLSLESKEAIALIVTREMLLKCKRPAILWNAGKDSMAVLNIVKKIALEIQHGIPPTIFVDHGLHFPETYEMIETVSNKWQFKVIRARNDDALKNVKDTHIHLENLNERNTEEAKSVRFEKERLNLSVKSEIGKHLLEVVPLEDVIRHYRIDGLFTGMKYIDITMNSKELFIVQEDMPRHSKIRPVLLFTDRDVWDYSFKNELPIHPLYYKGYKSVKNTIESTGRGDHPIWERTLEHRGVRSNSPLNREEVTENLRRMGYI